MVQMKQAKTENSIYRRQKLYIPHGSDETCQYFCAIPVPKVLYIPHGSDETSNKVM